jgi:cytochrome c oxidase subunit II
MDIESVRRLREQYEAVLDDAETARAAYHRALRDLHRSGVPLRALAEQLGMSYQRVHQIVGSEPARKSGRRVAGAIGAAILAGVGLFTALVWAERSSIETPSRPSTINVDVLTRGRMWRFDYDRFGVSVADRSPEVFLPARSSIRLALRTADVSHSIWVPRLAGKRDIIPGRTTTLTLHTGAPDRYWGADVEFAGIEHELPRFEVRVVPLTVFERWITEVRAPSI